MVRARRAASVALLFGNLALLIPSLVSAWLCEDPDTYYASAAGLSGAALQTELTSIIRKEYFSVFYSRAWDAISVLDETAPGSGRVRLIYADTTGPVQEGCPNNDCVWTREHLWPQSYGVDPNDRDNGPSYSDLFNLYATVRQANTDRSNDIYEQITDSSGNCLPAYEGCEVPGHESSAADTAEFDNTYWQPPANVRGDIARALMYMQVRYDGTETNTADLNLVEEPPETSTNTEPSTRVFGKLSTLLQWHCDDPVDDVERARNDAICKDWQRNRNPFVDNPSYVQSIFPTPAQVPSCYSDGAPPSGTPVAVGEDSAAASLAGQGLATIAAATTALLVVLVAAW